MKIFFLQTWKKVPPFVLLILQFNIFMYDTCMCDAYIYDPQYLMHEFMMLGCMTHTSMILVPDPDTCMHL